MNISFRVGLRKYRKVNTLSIFTLRSDEKGASKECIGKVSTNEFLQIAQVLLLNFNILV